MFYGDQVVQHREEAHPAFFDQLNRWREIAEEVCPEGYLVSISGVAVGNEEDSPIG